MEQRKVSFHMDQDMHDKIKAAAEENGEVLSSFFRRAAVAAYKELIGERPSGHSTDMFRQGLLEKGAERFADTAIKMADALEEKREKGLISGDEWSKAAHEVLEAIGKADDAYRFLAESINAERIRREEE